jgi:hypothetical protein
MDYEKVRQEEEYEKRKAQIFIESIRSIIEKPLPPKIKAEQIKYFTKQIYPNEQ